MRVYEVKNYNKGTINNLEAKSIGPGAASDSLNWLSMGDHIELRRGYRVVGTENAGTGRITGLHVARKIDGTTQPFATYLRKLKYYDSATEDWVEIGADSLPAAASDEDVYFAAYTSLAGYQTLLSSPNSSFYKIMNANPGTLIDIFDAAKTFKGKIKLNNGRTVLWARAIDKANLYGSWIDAQDSSVYTTVASENIGTGTGAQVTFNDTLAFKAGGARRNCFAITVTDSVETFTDNRNGTLTGSAGGTGTINYATGAISVTFAVAPNNLQAITADYQWEDSAAKGVSDFSSSATRVAGEGFFLQQSTGGELKAVEIIKDNWYCLHESAAWYVNMPANDLTPLNKIFRERIGFANTRGATSTGDGIFYIDVTYPEHPNFSLLRFSDANPEVQPYVYTYNVLLDGFDLSDLTTVEYGDLILHEMKSSSAATGNDVTFVYNKQWKTIDRLDFNLRCAAENNGYLWVGDSLSTNVLEIFSGYDDNNSLIDNYWIGDISELGIDYLKKFKRLNIEGYIAPSQNVEVYIAYDHEDFSLIGEIAGNGTYVDINDPVLIGSSGVGMKVVGGGDNGTEVYHYIREFRIRADKFRTAQIKFVATGGGYVSISQQTWYDIKTYGQKQPLRYRATT